MRNQDSNAFHRAEVPNFLFWDASPHTLQIKTAVFAARTRGGATKRRIFTAENGTTPHSPPLENKTSIHQRLRTGRQQYGPEPEPFVLPSGWVQSVPPEREVVLKLMKHIKGTNNPFNEPRSGQPRAESFYTFLGQESPNVRSSAAG